jgi:hypothetical protein
MSGFSRRSQAVIATALLDMEPRLRRIREHRYLPLLREAMKDQMKTDVRTAA